MSCTSRRTCGVYSGSKWRSSTKIRSTRPVGPDLTRGAVGRTIPSGAAGAGAAIVLNVRPPCTSANESIVCGDAVLENGEVVLRQIGDEPSLVVARDHVGRHVRDRRREMSAACGGGLCAATADRSGCAADQRQRRRARSRAWPVIGRASSAVVLTLHLQDPVATRAIPTGASAMDRRAMLGAGIAWGGVTLLGRRGAHRRTAMRAARATQRRSASCSASSRCTATRRARRRSARCSAGPGSTRGFHRSLDAAARSSGHADGRGLRPHGRAAPRRRSRRGRSTARGFQPADSLDVDREHSRRARPDGRASDRVLRQRRSRQLRADERRRVGRRAARGVAARPCAGRRRRPQPSSSAASTTPPVVAQLRRPARAGCFRSTRSNDSARFSRCA